MLCAHVGPIGTATVTFTLDPHGESGDEPGDESGEETEVALTEVPDAGMVRVLWSTLGRILLLFGLWGRNEASLQLLKAYVEGVEDGADGSEGAPRADAASAAAVLERDEASRRAAAVTTPEN